MVIARSWDYQEGCTYGTLLAGTPGLAPNHDRHDAPPRRMLPLLVVVIRVKTADRLQRNRVGSKLEVWGCVDKDILFKDRHGVCSISDARHKENA